METFWPAAWALWLGVLTAISPCPLATNIAAISYIGRRVGSSRQVFWTGMLYTLGRTAAYLGLAVLLVATALSIPRVSMFLQTYMNEALGPILIVVAMCLLGIVRLRLTGGAISDPMQRRVDALGLWGAGLLGILFALSFCPVSAALFFGSLIPLSIRCGSKLAVPLAYGIGTALPVITFAMLIAVGAGRAAKAFRGLARVEWWARRLTGVIFLAVGIDYSLRYIFQLNLFWAPWLERLGKLIA